MGSAISLRSDYDGDGLRRLARQTRDAHQARRLLALASIYDGGSRANAARIGSVTVHIVRARLGVALQRTRSRRAGQREGSGAELCCVRSRTPLTGVLRPAKIMESQHRHHLISLKHIPALHRS